MDNEKCTNSSDEKQLQSQVDIEFDAEAEWLSSQNDLKVEPPEIPNFTDNLRICDISPEIEKRLAMMLDLPAVGNSLKNWEWLAFSLGMSWEEIKYLRIRAQHPSSPTSELLWRYRGESFGRILNLIRDHLNRFDVIVELLPALCALEERLKLDGTPVNKEEKLDNKKPEREDSGILLSSAKSCTFDQPSTSGFNNNKPREVGALFNLRVSSNSSVASSVDPALQNFTNTMLETECNGAKSKSNFILITYHNENEKHLKLVNWLCKNLRQSGANVISSEQLIRNSSGDLATGFASAFQKANSIVVVCSSGYRRCVESLDDFVVNDIHVQYTLFLYKLMFAEYKELNCKNKRFRPILFEGSTDADVPSFLKNTLVHRWPQQHEPLMEFLFED